MFGVHKVDRLRLANANLQPDPGSAALKVAGTVLKHANYSLLAVTTVMQYAHTYVSVAVRLPALRVINVRVHVRFHREAILPELAHP